MKPILKYIFIITATIVAFVLFYFLTAFCLARIAVNNDRPESNDITIYLLSNGVHADIVVPVKSFGMDWSSLVKYENTTGNDTTEKWLGFGWGDKGFYLQTPTWNDLTFGVAFRAITGLGTSAMHTTFHTYPIESARCRSIQISREEYQRLTDFILAGFEKSPSGELIPIVTSANYTTHDAFYEGEGRYHLFNTCNTWTNNALKYTGLKTGMWTPFASGVLYHYAD